MTVPLPESKKKLQQLDLPNTHNMNTETRTLPNVPQWLFINTEGMLFSTISKQDGHWSRKKEKKDFYEVVIMHCEANS